MNIFRKFFLLLALSLISQTIMAAWSLEPSYFLRYERNDNIYLQTQDNELAVKGGTFGPAIKAILEEEDQSLVADVNLQFTRYKDHKELDRDEGKAGLNWRKATELSVYGISASYSDKSNLDNTLETSGIQQNIKQKTSNISPNWRYQIGERWNVSADLSYTDTEYDEPGIPGYNNFKVVNFINSTEQSGSIALGREMTERDSISLTYYQSAYEGEGNGLQIIKGLVCQNSIYDPNSCAKFPAGPTSVVQANERKQEYDYRVWQIGYEHLFQENSSVSLQAGSSVTQIVNQTFPHYFDQIFTEVFSIPPATRSVNQSEKKGQVYNVTYKQQSEISSFELSAGRNRVASSTGGLDETDTAKIYYTNSITERLSWSLDVNSAKYKPDQDISVLAVNNYRRTSASPYIYYKLNVNWTMSLGYIYAKKDIETDALPRESNTVFFNMSWREPKLLSTN